MKNLVRINLVWQKNIQLRNHKVIHLAPAKSTKELLQLHNYQSFREKINQRLYWDASVRFRNKLTGQIGEGIGLKIRHFWDKLEILWKTSGWLLREKKVNTNDRGVIRPEYQGIKPDKKTKDKQINLPWIIKYDWWSMKELSEWDKLQRAIYDYSQKYTWDVIIM